MPSQTVAAQALLAAATCLALLAAPHTSLRASCTEDGQAEATPAVALDVVVTDREGLFVENLRPNDFLVSVNGTRRAVVSLRRVSRGPGAIEEAASWRGSGDPAVSFVAELRRTVLVIVDEAMLARGDERGVVQAAGAFLDRLGLDDRVAVLRIPTATDSRLNFTTERPEARQALRRVAGQRMPGSGLAGASVVQRLDAVGDADRTPDPERVQIPAERTDPTAVPVGDAMLGILDPSSTHDSLSALQAVFQALRQIPGRKVVALFSAGLPASIGLYLNDTARAAAAAHAVVYAFGVRSGGFDARDAPDTAALERLAVSTGGSFVMLSKNPDRVVERVVTEMAACYALVLEPRAGEAPLQNVRVEIAKRGFAVRAAAWVAPGVDAGDQVVLPPIPAEAPTPAVPKPAAPPPKLADTRAPAPAARGRELQLALARLFEYADGYERQYSALVAEENYRQSTSSSTARIRSDVLLVRDELSGQWMSFRDVFEVNGRPVRDREERLQRLFLGPSAEARTKLDAISAESSRYNIGAVERTVNVPLFPLVFLRQVNRFRLDYELSEHDEAEGVRAWRIRYVEKARPTIVSDLQKQDVPQSGWFLVDTVTGAIVETGMEASREGTKARIVVRYRRDPVLGLWVPAEMRETYTEPRNPTRGGITDAVFLEGRATYSNFRRFQVTTEERINIPK